MRRAVFALLTLAAFGASAQMDGPIHLTVNTTADEGPGSLRETLLDAASRCAAAPCILEFNIPAPVPTEGWFTIRPATPLPDVRGSVRIDGATQTAFTGDTNPNGPEIEINGSLLDAGNGFVFRNGCDVGVSDVVINGFPRHAIEIDQDSRFESCTQWPGTTGAVIARNVLGRNERGVVLANGNSIEIASNLISGNRRAGIFIGKGQYAEIVNNRILGNGASGIFLNTDGSFTGGADVTGNIVASTANGESAGPTGDASASAAIPSTATRRRGSTPASITSARFGSTTEAVHRMRRCSSPRRTIRSATRRSYAAGSPAMSIVRAW